MEAEEVVLNLIKHEKKRNGGTIHEPRIIKMATLLNIHPDTYQRIRERLIERGKIAKTGMKLSLP